ncbi:helix-turn-helix domain-containing protein [Mucisphaera sp.]|uniref:helix-turn-helix domain-containing protein n=1 Tax=Mucisphaera sp. TaxID=2913024 RepID=UPI003D0CDB2D
MNKHMPEPNGPYPSLLLNDREAARSLSISTRYLWELANSGEIPSVKLGRRRLYSRDQLKAWVDKRSSGPNSS